MFSLTIQEILSDSSLIVKVKFLGQFRQTVYGCIYNYIVCVVRTDILNQQLQILGNGKV